ncbi:MAG: UbiA family prenyltransferase [Ruminococcus sp.]|nr:UbiA family prenyltransferase [Candidatus Apopatosoma intestinale]
MKKYLSLMRFDHWIKQLFILPGILVALVLTKDLPSAQSIGLRTVAGFLSVCLVASSNYVINEWLDAGSDRYHPVKKNPVAETERLNPKAVCLFYVGSLLTGLLIALAVSRTFVFTMLWLWGMGVLYNVKPFRVKDIPYLDVFAESVNSAIRLLAGWFIVTDRFLPPVSAVLGYWFAGAFLMAAKRFAEYRMIHDPEAAGRYRRSFRTYSARSLAILSFFCAMLSVFFIGVFLIKYRIELILFMPFFIGLFCYYAHIACQEDSAAQRPEKLVREKGLLLYLLILAVVFAVTMTVDIPWLDQLLSDVLIPIS